MGQEFNKLLDAHGLRREGVGFYALRHSFETHAGEAKDPHATSAIMGHAPASGDMLAVYRERVSDERLKTVTEHERRLVIPSKSAPMKRKATPC